jgi:hypothetical protein
LAGFGSQLACNVDFRWSRLRLAWALQLIDRRERDRRARRRDPLDESENANAPGSQARNRKGSRQMTSRCTPGLLTAILPVLLLSCVSQSITPPVWSYYDNCATQNPSFVAMAKCGRERRLAECEPKNRCSAEGTLFMEYADSLALSVKNKKQSETEAFRLLAEYKTGRPCTVIGNTVNCR